MSLITVPQVNPNDEVTALSVNQGPNAIAAIVNGQLDDSNISGLNGSKITAGSLPSSALTSDTVGGWNPLGFTFSSVTALGNHSYSCVVSGQNVTNLINPGTRLRTTRTVPAPTQSTLLNGTNQYFSKTSPAGMTFTGPFVVSACVKLTSYPSSGNGVIVSRFNGTSGWGLWTDSNGKVGLVGWNGGSANFSQIGSYQSLPLNKWVHITAQLDMSAYTATPTTSYIMIDGVDVPGQLLRGGSNPTSILQAGNIEIGSWNSAAAGSLFSGKIAQVAVFNAKVTQATILASMNQGLLGTETNLISAYSFNGVITDLNTTNANNLTANNGAVAINADSPFGGQASGLISSTIDYGIVQSAVFATNTTLIVQVPEGCTIPITGGVSAVSYSSAKAPYGFPGQYGKWAVEVRLSVDDIVSITSVNQWFAHAIKFSVPVGEWDIGYMLNHQVDSGAGQNTSTFTIASSAPTNASYLDELGSSYSMSSVTIASSYLNKSLTRTLAAATVFTPYTQVASAGTTANARIRGSQSQARFVAKNALL